MSSLTFSSHGSAAARRADRRVIGLWLMLCCALVFIMVVVGGVTRLTRSGLSIVEWKPLMGAIPPLDEQDWTALFQNYQQTPEYQKVNQGMGLEGFKRIFWWEYIHRLIGRLIGIVFFVPLLYFVLRRRVERALVPRMAGIFLLGALQGAVGWWMVKSGLVDDPRVSHFRLTIHLGMAFLIFAAMFWTALGLLRRPADGVPALARPALLLSGWIFVMVLTGGLVAGTRAGLFYNTFPLMNGQVLPSEAFVLTPWWSNFFHTVGAVQFVHRCIAWSLFLLVPWLWWKCRHAPLEGNNRLAVNLFLLMLIVQIALGIATLLLRVPVTLGAAHQGGALLLFALSLWVAAILNGQRRY